MVTANEKRATLSLRQPTDGARGPLQKQLGAGVDVGHMQIRVEIDRDDLEWIDELMAVIEQIKMFKEQMIQMMEIVQSSAADSSAISSIPTG